MTLPVPRPPVPRSVNVAGVDMAANGQVAVALENEAADDREVDNAVVSVNLGVLEAMRKFALTGCMNQKKNCRTG